VTDSGTLYGREAVEKHYADLFQKEHFSNYLVKADQYSQPRALGPQNDQDHPGLPILKLHCGKLTLKIYTKGERVLRIEVVVHNTQELQCGRSLEKFPQIVVQFWCDSSMR
jgi:hypothetical protein